jgi:hypothetical protein
LQLCSQRLLLIRIVVGTLTSLTHVCWIILFYFIFEDSISTNDNIIPKYFITFFTFLQKKVFFVSFFFFFPLENFNISEK